MSTPTLSNSPAGQPSGLKLKTRNSKLSFLSYLPIYLLGFLMFGLLIIPMILSLLVALTPGDTIDIPTPDRWSLRWFERFFQDPIWQRGALNSLVVAALTALISLVTGTTAAIAFERHEFRGKSALNLFLLTPLFVPPVVLGIQNLTWHQRIGVWGSVFSLALAHSLWAMPLVLMVMRSALRSVDRRLEDAAAGMGAGPLAVFWRVTLPLIWPGLLVSVFFAFIISFNEFVMSLFLATPRTQTISTLIYPQLRYNLSPLVAAASAVLLGLTMLVLLTAVRLLNVKKLL